MLAIPVLAGSAAYAVGEGLTWNASLEEKPKDARGFYSVIAVSTLIGIALNFIGINRRGPGVGGMIRCNPRQRECWLKRFDRFIRREGYDTRSEPFRDPVRDQLNDARMESDDVSYVTDDSDAAVLKADCRAQTAHFS
jgi:hypothetical protein